MPGKEPKHPIGKMSMLQDMPPGLKSPSGHYRCAMGKKMFQIDGPTCPYMPSMCVNTPIPVEALPLSSALASVPNPAGFAAASRESLLERLRDWGFAVGDDEKLTAQPTLHFGLGSALLWHPKRP